MKGATVSSKGVALFFFPTLKGASVSDPNPEGQKVEGIGSRAERRPDFEPEPYLDFQSELEKTFFWFPLDSANYIEL